MPIDGGGLNFLGFLTGEFAVKVFFVTFLVFYSIFAFILLRQIDLMSSKLPTSINPSLKFIALVNLGISTAFIFIVGGLF